MDQQIWTIISAVSMGLLVPVTGALGIWGAAQVKRWQARTDLKTMKQNALDAVQAVQQLYPDSPPDEKKKLALAWAQHLNTDAGVMALPETLDIHTESAVVEMKKNKPPAPPVVVPVEIDQMPKG